MTTYFTAQPVITAEQQRAFKRRQELLAAVQAWRQTPSSPIEYEAEYTRIISEYGRGAMLDLICFLLDQTGIEK